MMKVGLCSIAFREWAVEDVLRTAGEIGFDGVEIWGKEKHMGELYDADRVKRLRDAASRAGVAIDVFGSYIQPLMADFDGASRNALDIADALGSNVIRVWAAEGRPGSLSGEDYARAVSKMASFCKLAAERGITPAIESHDNYIVETSAAMLRFIEDVAMDNLKVNWQASWREDTDDPYESLAALMPYIVNVHAQNYDRQERKRRFLAEGMVDYRRAIEELRKAGFDGYIEVEFVAGDGSVEALKKDYDFLCSLVNGR